MAIIIVRDPIAGPMDPSLVGQDGIEIRPVPYWDAMLYARYLYECAVNYGKDNPARNVPVVTTNRKLCVFWATGSAM